MNNIYIWNVVRASLFSILFINYNDYLFVIKCACYQKVMINLLYLSEMLVNSIATNIKWLVGVDWAYKNI